MEFEQKDPRPKRSMSANAPLVGIAYKIKSEERIGEWIKVAEYQNRGSGISSASSLRLKTPMAWPTGHWEFEGQEAEDGSCSELFVKYNGPADEVIVDNGGRRRKGFVAAKGKPPEDQVETERIDMRVQRIDPETITPKNEEPFDGIKGMNFDELD